MRSCLRRPLVPAISRLRASLPSSAMLCSFNSEIVMVYLEWFEVKEGFLWGFLGGIQLVCRGRAEGPKFYCGMVEVDGLSCPAHRGTTARLKPRGAPVILPC